MKNIPTFSEFINESTESSEYTYKEDSGGGRPTMILKLKPSAWETVKHLFGEESGKTFRPVDPGIKNIGARGYSWDLYAVPVKLSNNDMEYRIFGRSGDWTFGNAPTYHQQAHRGNKKAAKEVFGYFIEKYLK